MHYDLSPSSWHMKPRPLCPPWQSLTSQLQPACRDRMTHLRTVLPVMSGDFDIHFVKFRGKISGKKNASLILGN